MKRYTEAQHRFFDGLVIFLSSICCLGIGLGCFRVGHPINPFYNRVRYINLQGISNVSNLELHFCPYDLLESLAKNIWPSVIELDESSLSGEPIGRLTQITTDIRMHAHLIESTFINYFESVRTNVEAKYGNNTQSWPEVWNFGRVVRNAFAHNGEVYFEKPRASAVTWKTLSYSPVDNGRQIVYRDLASAEIILLMEDMDATV